MGSAGEVLSGAYFLYTVSLNWQTHLYYIYIDSMDTVFMSTSITLAF